VLSGSGNTPRLKPVYPEPPTRAMDRVLLARPVLQQEKLRTGESPGKHLVAPADGALARIRNVASVQRRDRVSASPHGRPARAPGLPLPARSASAKASETATPAPAVPRIPAAPPRLALARESTTQAADLEIGRPTAMVRSLSGSGPLRLDPALAQRLARKPQAEPGRPPVMVRSRTPTGTVCVRLDPSLTESLARQNQRLATGESTLWHLSLAPAGRGASVVDPRPQEERSCQAEVKEPALSSVPLAPTDDKMLVQGSLAGCGPSGKERLRPLPLELLPHRSQRSNRAAPLLVVTVVAMLACWLYWHALPVRSISQR